MCTKDRVKKEANREWRETSKLKISTKKRLVYHSNPSPQKAAAREFSRRSFACNPEPKRAAARKASKVNFARNPEPKRAAARKASKVSFARNPEPKRKASKLSFARNPEPKGQLLEKPPKLVLHTIQSHRGQLLGKHLNRAIKTTP